MLGGHRGEGNERMCVAKHPRRKDRSSHPRGDGLVFFNAAKYGYLSCGASRAAATVSSHLVRLRAVAHLRILSAK